jgi:hypothetical protein
MGINLILVHIGSEFPNYINDCIKQLNKYNINTHLLIPSNLHEFVTEKNINLCKIEDYYSDEFLNFKNNYDESFRDGFWKSTSSRFIILNNYIVKNKLENIFHIENDVLIFSNLIEINDILKSSNCNMSLVMDSDNRCIPSIIWLRNEVISNRLSSFILNNNSNNDMENLSSFYHTNNDVFNFPIIPDIDINSVINNTNNNIVNYSNMFTEYKTIFDGAAIGQYLGGVDPRNQPGNTIGFVNETTIFDVSKFKFEWINNEPYMIYNDQIVKINNLHIHSKKLENFI